MTRETRTGDANDYNDGNNDVDDDLTLDNDKGLPARQVRLFPLTGRTTTTTVIVGMT